MRYFSQVVNLHLPCVNEKFVVSNNNKKNDYINLGVRYLWSKFVSDYNIGHLIKI